MSSESNFLNPLVLSRVTDGDDIASRIVDVAHPLVSGSPSRSLLLLSLPGLRPRNGSVNRAGFAPSGTRTTVGLCWCRRTRVSSSRAIPPADGDSVAGVVGDERRRRAEGRRRGRWSYGSEL